MRERGSSLACCRRKLAGTSWLWLMLVKLNPRVEDQGFVDPTFLLAVVMLLLLLQYI